MGEPFRKIGGGIFTDTNIHTWNSGIFEVQHQEGEEIKRGKWLVKGLKTPKQKEHGITGKEELITSAQKIKELLALQKSFLGEFIPEYHITIGEKEFSDEEKHRSYIKGKPLDPKTIFLFMEIVYEKKETSESKKFQALDQIIERSLEFYRKTYDPKVKTMVYENAVYGIGYFSDIKDANIVFGSTEDNKEPRYYLIDNYPPIKRTLGQINGLAKNIFDIYSEHDFPLSKAKLETINLELSNVDTQS